MNTYIQEIFESGIYKVKHIAGMNASETAKPSYHSSIRLMFSYFVKGGGSIIIDDTRYDIADGDFFVLKPAEFFMHNIDDSCFHERIVLITSVQIDKNLPSNCSDVLSPFFRRNKGEKNRIPGNVAKKYHLDRLFNELLGYLKAEDETNNILAFSRVLEILVVINKIITKELTSNDSNIIRNSKVNDILKYLNSNYTKDISITDVAKKFNLDRSYLSRLFKSQMGMSVWDYVIMRRIYLFNYLINDNSSMEETAYRVGFKNYSNFYRLYKKYMLMTPTEFKKSLYNPDNT